MQILAVLIWNQIVLGEDTHSSGTDPSSNTQKIPVPSTMISDNIPDQAIPKCNRALALLDALEARGTRTHRDTLQSPTVGKCALRAR